MSARQRELREEFTRVHGSCPAGWDAVLRLDPDFFAAYLELAAVPRRTGHLEPRVRELVLLAADAATTHLYVPGIVEHVRAALAAGATPAEVMEVLELISAVGVHSIQVGVPLLLEVLAEEGLRSGPAPATARQQQLRARFVEARGYWAPFWDDFLEVAPDFFEAYTRFSAHPWRTGALDPRTKELVYCALDAATTHLYAPGLKAHLRNALRLGATPEQLTEVLELVSLMGIHAAVVAAPVLAAEVDGR